MAAVADCCEWISLAGVWEAAEDYGRMVDAQKRAYNTARFYTSRSTNAVGRLGEFVFALHFDLPVNDGLLAEGDGGHDFVVNGETVDVKTSQRMQFPIDLILENPPRHWSDLYVLAQLDARRKLGRLLGWTSQMEFKAKSCIKNFGYGDKLAMPFALLRPMADWGIGTER